MDIISHGLWGAAAFEKQGRKNFWLAFLFGVAPDMLSFGIFFLARLFGFYGQMHFGGRPDADMVPSFVGHLYNVTHSLVIFAAVFLLVWFFLQRPLWPMLAWGMHIALDIFSHDRSFFPTPFLWPLSDYKFDAISWGDPRIYIPNVVLLLAVYVWLYISSRKKNRT